MACLSVINPPLWREEFARLIKAHPREYIAQPIISLSRHPTFCEEGIEGRHVDLSLLFFTGRMLKLLRGLTRVALKKGSLVVNSSQGGVVKTLGY